MNDSRPSVRLGLSLISAGSVFFFNPFINVLDLLPDCIGALLILLGLAKLRDITSYFDRSRTAFRRLFWVSLSRIPAFFVMYKIFVEHATEQSIMTVFTYCYAIAETVLVFAAFSNFFNGMIYSGERYENTSVFRTVPTVKTENGYLRAPESAKEGKKPPFRFEVSQLKIFTILSLVALRAFSILPELVYINGQPGEEFYRVSQTVFKPIYFTLTFLPALTLGIAWLVAFRRYCHGVASDDVFCSAVLAYYDANYPKTHKLHLFRRFERGAILLAATAIFSADFFLDGRNILPDILAAVMLLCAVFYCDKRVTPVPSAIRTMTVGVVAVSALSFVAELRFFGTFAFSDVWRKDEATARYLIWLISDGVSTALFFALFASLVCLLLRFVMRELGGDDIGSLNSRARGEIAEFKRRGVTFSVIATLATISSVLFRLFLADTESVQIAEQGYIDATHLYVPRVDFYWLIDLCFSVAVLCAMLWFFEKAKESLQYKYSLE